MTPETYTPVKLSAEEDIYLTPKKAADYIGVMPETLAKWRLKGLGPEFSAAFGKPRYRLSWIIDWMSSQTAINTRHAETLRLKRKIQ